MLLINSSPSTDIQFVVRAFLKRLVHFATVVNICTNNTSQKKEKHLLIYLMKYISQICSRSLPPNIYISNY